MPLFLACSEASLDDALSGHVDLDLDGGPDVGRDADLPLALDVLEQLLQHRVLVGKTDEVQQDLLSISGPVAVNAGGHLLLAHTGLSVVVNHLAGLDDVLVIDVLDFVTCAK